MSEVGNKGFMSSTKIASQSLVYNPSLWFDLGSRRPKSSLSYVSYTLSILPCLPSLTSPMNGPVKIGLPFIGGSTH